MCDLPDERRERLIGKRAAYLEYVRNITGTDVKFDEPSLRQPSLRGKRLTQGVTIFDINACKTFELVGRQVAFHLLLHSHVFRAY